MIACVGRKLVKKSIDHMKEQGADEVILETELTNQAALRLYECKIKVIVTCMLSIWIHQR